MSEKKKFLLNLLIPLIGIVTLTAIGFEPSRVHAQVPTPLASYGTCIKCHEDLYFLHDTGNWFCIRESPMQCVDCHGDDLYAIKQEEAHAARKAHPIVNENVSKCQECHPEECEERVAKFDKIAGISDVLVAFPYQPTPAISFEKPMDRQATEPDKYPGWISAMEVLALLLIAGLALGIHIFHHVRHPKTNKKEQYK